MSNDFTFDCGLPINSSPPGLMSGRPGLPGPFAPAPLQGSHHYYGPIRPCAPRYSATRGVRRLQFSLLPTAWQGHLMNGRTVSGRQVLLFHASAYDELTPPIHRAPPGPQAGRSLAQFAP
jgi:hypothetical protein